MQRALRGSAVIQTAFFDLDGTLVQSEKLKADAYAQAVRKLLAPEHSDPQDSFYLRVIDAYCDLVESSRELASRHIVDPVALNEALTPMRADYGGAELADVLTQVRVSICGEMVSDPQMVLRHR
jgi:beta-phosphoglucomutase